MKRLKNLHRNDKAAIVFGGPSLYEKGFDFQSLREKGFVIFLEAQALTKWFLTRGIQPDYYLMVFPEKCHGNSLHNFILRSFLAGVEPKWFLQKRHHPILYDMQNNFSDYFESWAPARGAHKKFKWKSEVYMPDSPFDLLTDLGDEVKIIANKKLLTAHFPGLLGSERLHLFDQAQEPEDFDLERYYNPDDSGTRLTLRNVQFVNSAAIGLYPLLSYMGFREVLFFGMDMSMLGSFEYAAPYIFKSMLHFRAYFWRTRNTFNANYVWNKPYYLRPPYEFENIKTLLNHENIRFTRVHDPSRWAATSIDGLRTITYDEFSEK